MRPMDRRADAPEHLDGPLGDAGVLADNLRDLRRVNRLLGGVALSSRAIDALLASHVTQGPGGGDATTIRMLDVGTGGADIPIALLAQWRRRGRQLEVTGVDSRPEVIAAARSDAGSVPGLELEVADGLALPYPDRSFDIAHASLVLHHLEPDAAVTLLRELSRVARLGVVINDLARGWLPWLGAWLLAHLATGNAFTRHDAPLSVRRAYTALEAVEMLELAGLRPIYRARGFLGHRWAIAARGT
jgi:ubiquinone/menaquinone biosynthesis C-methylase UbiE